MSKLWARLAEIFRSRAQVGVDKVGNQYFTRIEEVDGIMKEKRWVIFKGEEDPTSIPVEWICWLSGQRKKAPTPEEMAELEARRERVKMNVALLKKEEEERKAKTGSGPQQTKKPGKVGGPDLRSFIRQFPGDQPGGEKVGAGSDIITDKQVVDEETIRSSEPTGSGQTFRPGTWQPPS